MAFYQSNLISSLVLPLEIVIGSILLYYFGVITYNVYLHPLSKFPGPKLRAASHIPELWHTLSGTATFETKKLHDKYGDVVRLSPTALSFNNSQAWRDIHGFVKDGRSQLKKDRTGFGDSPGDANILIANDTDHARMRKLLSHAMSDKALREQEPVITFHLKNLVAKLTERIDGPSEGVSDLTHWYTFTAFDIIGDLGLGSSFGALNNGGFHFWIENLFKSIKFLGILRLAETYKIFGLLFNFMITAIPSLSKHRDLHIKLTSDKTLNRMRNKVTREDFMTHVQRYEDDARGMNEKETVQTFAFVIVAGSETIATAASGMTWYLLKHPDIMKRLKEEIRNAFQTEEDINFATTANLPYLGAVIEETLRIYPPAPSSFPRKTDKEGNVINGEYVPGNFTVGVHQWSTYKSTKNFADPEIFDPDRWLENAPEKYSKDNKFALQPFGIGPRQCIGRSLFYLELRSIMVRMLWHFELELCEDSQNWKNHKVFLMWEKPALNVKLTRRQGI